MVGLYHHGHEDHHAYQTGKPNGHKERALGQQAPTEDHDDDAVYVSGLVMLGWRSWYSQVASQNASPLALMNALAGSPFTAALSLWPAHPPSSFVCYHCPIYLRTLALLI
jgi:hypothetical protein